MNIIRKEFLGLLILVIISSCAGTKRPDDFCRFDKAQLPGMVYSSENRPCPNALVTLEAGTKEAKTDIQGRFVLPDVKRGSNFLLISCPGFESRRIDFLFTDRSQVFYIKLSSFGTLINEAEQKLAENKPDEAILICDRALSIYPESIEALFLKALIYLKIDQIDLCLSLLNSEKLSQNKYAVQLKEQLQPLKGEIK